MRTTFFPLQASVDRVTAWGIVRDHSNSSNRSTHVHRRSASRRYFNAELIVEETHPIIQFGSVRHILEHA
jgi:hypothetical protein